MKKKLLILAIVFLLTSCRESSTIENNPVIEKINIISNQTPFKYEVYFKTNSTEQDSKMLTNFRYQVGDTLISFTEYFESKLKPIKDSLTFYQKKYFEVSKENVNLNINLKYLENKLDKTEQK